MLRFVGTPVSAKCQCKSSNEKSKEIQMSKNDSSISRAYEQTRFASYCVRGPSCAVFSGFFITLSSLLHQCSSVSFVQKCDSFIRAGVGGCILHSVLI